MSGRQRVLLRPVDESRYAQVVGPDDLAQLLDDLDVYGPETFGFVVEIATGFRADLPDGWAADRLGDGPDHGITGP